MVRVSRTGPEAGRAPWLTGTGRRGLLPTYKDERCYFDKFMPG
jgi:hypothetical protein